ncbi:helix-turn-helix domain-containing protein [Actinoallomurus acaciae]|uniref:Helix-turn-helix transcriptional regulator n=1 Tax=Actinoallomurus acaciae TaxID=502577 RepID=A0ABV5YA43_9ACTN
MGGALDVRAAVEWARRARGPRRRPSNGRAGLTPAERSVVRLAAEGLSNPDIGARLFMSRSTVKTHLSHVYTKLDVTSRAELAALAAPHLAED